MAGTSKAAALPSSASEPGRVGDLWHAASKNRNLPLLYNKYNMCDCVCDSECVCVKSVQSIKCVKMCTMYKNVGRCLGVQGDRFDSRRRRAPDHTAKRLIPGNKE